MRDLLIGGVLGAFAALAAVRRRSPPERTVTTGPAAFEDAPCYREALERESVSTCSFLSCESATRLHHRERRIGVADRKRLPTS